MSEDKKILHRKTFAIEWGDMDALGHVNNGRYFDYFQQARLDWLESSGFTLRDKTGPVLIHVACTFYKPIIYPAIITIVSSLHSIGRSSFMIDHEIFQADTLMTSATSKIVWVDYVENKSIPVPDELRDLLTSPP